MEISNKTLAWLVVAAIVVSIFGTTVSLWNLNNKENFVGYATSNDTAGASVSVSQSVVLHFAINTTNFGSGSVNSSSGAWGCSLGINGSTTIYQTGCTGFSTTGTPLVVENIGTSFLSVTLNVTQNATSFLGNNVADAIGSGAFRYTVSNNESSSCVGTLGSNTWTIVPNNSVATATNICTNLSYLSASNSLQIGLNLTITNNATPGSKFVVFIAQGTNI